jgi:hypothetical protein
MQLIALRLLDADSLIRSHEGNIGQKTISGEFVEKNYKHLKETKLWCVDPCTEDYLSKDKTEFTNFNGFSPDVKKTVLSFDDKNHAQTWKSLSGNASKLMKFILENAQAQVRAGADFVIPPSPLISATDPKYIVDVWYDIVKTTATYSKTNLEKDSCIFLNLHGNNFQNTEKLNLILEKLFQEVSEAEIGDIKLIILKIKSPRFEEAPCRARFKSFIENLSRYAASTERALLLLDTDSMGLISIALGIDGFIEPINGVVGGEIRRSKEKRGRYYHPEALRFYSFPDMVDIYKNSNQRLPCDCSFCSHIKGNGIEDINIEMWNLGRRLHLITKRNDEISECHKEINDNTISTSMVDKIQRSDIKNMLDLL